MAQTTSEIYQQLIDEKNAMAELTALQPAIDDEQTLLSDLNTPSKVADWRLWLYVFALASRSLQQLWDNFSAIFKKQIEQAKAGSAKWLQMKGLQYQAGFSLIWNGNEFVFDNTGASDAVIEASKIVKALAIVETEGQVVAKAATITGGVLAQMSAPDVAGLASYLAKIAPAGTNLAVVSRPPDDLVFYADVLYDPAILSSSGELINTPGTFPVTDAVKNYLSNLPFNGRFDTTALQDAIQGASGVRRVVLHITYAGYGSLFPLSVIDTYTPDAGYMALGAAYLNYYPDVY